MQENTKKKRNIQKNPGEIAADIIIYGLLGLIALSTVLPFLYVIAGSFSTDKELTEKAFFLLPEVWTLNAYKYAIRTVNILQGLRNSVFFTALGTALCMIFTTLFAYPLSKPHLRGRGFLMNMVIVTMLFGGGMIPSYMVYCAYGLYDTYWALILPALISPFNMIIVKKFFQELPKELEDAAYVDGCGDMGIFLKIMLPLAKPVIASVSLFYGVGFWNDYFNAMIYLRTPEKYPVQVQLRSVINLTTLANMNMDYYDITGTPPDKAVKMACTVIATVPILAIYPFVQKYFTKGIMVGAVKG